MPLIQVQNLSKSVPDSGRMLTILDDVSFDVQAGETVAIIGASGSGKSTLLGLLAGLDLPTSGDVQVDGQSLFAWDEEQRAHWRAEQVGFVFQSFQLLARVGLAERAGHYPRTLSGGEQQRVALARAFASSPRLLFADEPTGSLDHATGERVIDLLFEMNRDFGATLILVTHDPRLAARCCRRLEIERGRLKAD